MGGILPTPARRGIRLHRALTHAVVGDAGPAPRASRWWVPNDRLGQGQAAGGSALVAFAR